MKKLSTFAACVALICSAEAFAGLKSTEIALQQVPTIGEFDTNTVLADSLVIEADTDFDLVTMEDEATVVVEVEEAMPIPEPAAAAILFAGLGSMAWMRYRLG